MAETSSTPEPDRRLAWCTPCDEAHPTCIGPPPEPDAGDVEALADELFRLKYGRPEVPESFDQSRKDALGARAVLASDWLADHDAEVARTAAKESGERIAVAIEGIRTHDSGVRACIERAARIAREEGARITRC